MSSYHIIPSTGEPGLCRAKIECPYNWHPHYDSKKEARAGFENLMEIGDKRIQLKNTYGGSTSASTQIRQMCDTFADKNGFNHQDAESWAARFFLSNHQFLCAVCGLAIHGTPDWDHVQPASKFGLKWQGNWTPEHGNCNRYEKGNADLRDVIELRLLDGKPTLWSSTENYDSFIQEFRKPYAERWPEFLKSGMEFDPIRSDLSTMLYKLTGVTIPPSMMERDRRIFDVKGPDSEFWKVSRAAYNDGYSEQNRNSYRSLIPEVQDRFRSRFGDVSVNSIAETEFTNWSVELLKEMYGRNNQGAYNWTRDILASFSSAAGKDVFVAQISTLGKEGFAKKFGLRD